MPQFHPIEPNPYIVGNPVRGRDMFFGRAEDLRFLADRLGAPGRQLVVLCGSRRCGKTSLLMQILDGRLGEDLFPVLVDLQQLAEVSGDADLWARVARRIRERMREEGVLTDGLLEIERGRDDGEAALRRLLEEQLRPAGEGSGGDGADPAGPAAPPPQVPETLVGFRRFLAEACRRLDGRKLVLLFDEYELIEEHTRAGGLGPATPLLLAALLDSDLPLALVFTGSRRVQERDPVVWRRLMPKAIHRRISFLARDDAERLIREPVRGRVRYTEAAVEGLLRLTAGHPFYTQVLCQALVDHLNRERRAVCDLPDLEAVADYVVDNPLPQMVYWWKGLPLLTRIAASVVAAAAGDADRWVEYRQVERHLRERRRDYGVDARAASVRGCLDQLVESEDLEVGTRRDEVRFRLDLARRWIRVEHPVWETVRAFGRPGEDLGGLARVRSRPRALLAAAAAALALAGLALLGWWLLDAAARRTPESPSAADAQALQAAHRQIERLEGELRFTRSELVAAVREAETLRLEIARQDLHQEHQAVLSVLRMRLAAAEQEVRATEEKVLRLEAELAVALSVAPVVVVRRGAPAAAPPPPVEPGCVEPADPPAFTPPPPPLPPPVPAAVVGPLELLPQAERYAAVRRTFEAVRGVVRRCTWGGPGVVQVEADVEGFSGRVSSVRVDGHFAGEARVCIEEAIRGLVFPPVTDRRVALHHSYRF